MLFTRARATGGWRYALAALALSSSFVAWVALPPSRTDAQSAEEPLATVEVSEHEDMVDGEPIDIVVRPRPGVTLTSGEALLCRDGESYTDAVRRPGQLLDTSPFFGGKCVDDGASPALSPNSSGSDVLEVFPDGTARGSLHVGVGTAGWRMEGGATGSLTCDAQNPCRLVVAVPVNGGTQFVVDSSTLVTFREADAVSGCDGTVDGHLNSGGADRLRETWIAWTRESCLAADEPLAPTLATLSSDGDGLATLAEGGIDLTYTAAGPTALGVGTELDDPVATPIALNATVLAVAGGHQTLDTATWPAHVPEPFTRVELTIDEVATILGQGSRVLEVPEVLTAASQRNPELGALGAACCVLGGKLNLLPGGTDARTVFASRTFDSLAPDNWKSHVALGSEPRDVYTDFNAPDPSKGRPEFQNYSIYTNSSTLAKEVYGISLLPAFERFGSLWALTDYATAIDLGMTPVSIQFEPGGPFVEPNPETIARGAELLEPGPDGMLEPSPERLGNDAGSEPAYPLTMVEYAVSRRDCERPADKSELLASWLSFVTGDGQQAMPEGMVALTPALAEQAQASIAEIGGPCEPAPPEDTLPTGPIGSDGGTPGTPGLGDPPGSSEIAGLDPLDSGAGTAADATAATDGAGGADEEGPAAAKEVADDAKIEMPPFVGIGAINRALPPASLLAVVALTSGVAMATSGKRLPDRVARIGRRLGRLPGIRRFVAGPAVP